MRLFLIFLFSSLCVFSQEKDSIREKLKRHIDTVNVSEDHRQLLRENLDMFVRYHKKQDLLELIGRILPDFNLQKLDQGKMWSESLRGKPTVINFWHSNSQHCIDESPTLNELQKQYATEVNFIAITYQTEREVRGFLEDVPFNYTHLINAQSYIQQIKLWNYPKTLVLDQDLRVHFVGAPKFSKTNEEEVENHQKFKEKIVEKLDDLLKMY